MSLFIEGSLQILLLLFFIVEIIINFTRGHKFLMMFPYSIVFVFVILFGLFITSGAEWKSKPSRPSLGQKYERESMFGSKATKEETFSSFSNLFRCIFFSQQRPFHLQIIAKVTLSSSAVHATQTSIVHFF